jgi:hypothetical protein
MGRYRGIRALAVLGAAVALAAFARQASPGLVGLWSLDEAALGTAADSSGSGNDGAHVGSPVPDTVEKAPLPGGTANAASLQLDQAGGDDYVEIPNSASLENVQEGSYSISAWFRPASVPATGAANRYAIVVKSGAANEGLSYYAPTGFTPPIGAVRFEHWLQDAATPGALTAVAWSFQADPLQWHHVVAVADDAAKEVRLYLNGALVGTNGANWGANLPAEHGQAPWRIGLADADPASLYRWPYPGHVDDVRIYNRALTLTDVLNMYSPSDSQAPVVTIDQPTTAPTFTAAAEPLAISGTATDNVAVTSVTWTTSMGAAGTTSLTGTTWSASVPLAPGTNVITVTATDAAGNTGTDTLTVTYGAAPPPPPGGDDDDSKCGCGTVAGASPSIAWILLSAGFLLAAAGIRIPRA